MVEKLKSMTYINFILVNSKEIHVESADKINHQEYIAAVVYGDNPNASFELFSKYNLFIDMDEITAIRVTTKNEPETSHPAEHPTDCRCESCQKMRDDLHLIPEISKPDDDKTPIQPGCGNLNTGCTCSMCQNYREKHEIKQIHKTNCDCYLCTATRFQLESEEKLKRHQKRGKGWNNGK